MKNLFALFFTFLLFGLIISCSKNSVEDNILETNVSSNETSTRAPGESCIRTNFNSGSCFEGVYTYSISIPSYPNCTFEVSVDYVNCVSDQGDRSIHLGDFVINEHDCPQYNTDLSIANTQNQLQTFQTSINQQVWAQVTNNLLNDNPPTLGTVIVLEYIVSQCTRTCYVNLTPKAGNPFIATVPRKINCGTNCCRLIDNYQETNGSWELANTINEPIFAGCLFTGVPFCLPNTVFSTDCDDNCDSLDF